MNTDKIDQLQQDILATEQQRDERLARVKELNLRISAQKDLLKKAIAEAYPLGSQWLTDVCGADQVVTVSTPRHEDDYTGWRDYPWHVFVVDEDDDGSWENVTNLKSRVLAVNDTPTRVFVSFDQDAQMTFTR